MIERLLTAEAALGRDELDVASRHFQLVADADPRNAIAVVGLARIAARRGDPDAARALLGRALEIDPDEAAAARLLGELDREAAQPEPGPPALAEPVQAQPSGADSAVAPKPAAPWWRRWLDRLRARG
jgi:tetratricopeptide (TPR) repeat protein